VETTGLDFLVLYPVFPLFSISISFSPKFDSCPFPVVFPHGTMYIKTDARPLASNNQASSPLSTSSSNSYNMVGDARRKSMHGPKGLE
jgi:hypothetical protein